MKDLLRPVLTGAGIVLAVMLAMWGGSCRGKQQANQDRAVERRGDSLRIEQRRDSTDLAARDARVDTARIETIRYVDRVITPGRTAPVPVDSVRGIVNRCTAERSACAEQRSAAEKLIQTLQAQVANRDEMIDIAARRPRFSATIDAGYEPFRKAPLFAVDGHMRLAGPIGIAARGTIQQELVMNERTQQADTTFAARLMVSLRYTF